jgi:ribosomal protein S18 acetylase RimI-like enzyme
MPSPMPVRPAQPEDAAAIAGLVRSSFRTQDLDLTIYGCDGIVEFLRGEIGVPERFSASRYRVAETNGRLVGFAETRSAAGRLWLNYIVTARNARGLGLGKKLLDGAFDAWQAPSGTERLLDVFEHNRTAREWYARLGYRVAARGGFWRVEADVPPAPVHVHGLPQADAVHRQFGFSTLTFAGAGRNVQAGRLGGRWLRISDASLLAAPEMLAAMQQFDRRRKILLNCAESIEAPPGVRCTPLLATERLHCFAS